MKDDFSFISVDYEEFKKGTYKAINLYFKNGKKFIFNSGDVIKDFKKAHKLVCEKKQLPIVFSSSFEDFVGLEKMRMNDFIDGWEEELKERMKELGYT